MNASLKGLIIITLINSLAYFVPALSGYAWYISKKNRPFYNTADLVVIILPLILYLSLIAIEDRQGFFAPFAVLTTGTFASLSFICLVLWPGMDSQSWRVVILVMFVLLIWMIFPESTMRMI
jgi:hypothetical protein